MIESHQNRINQIRSSFKRILRAKEGIDYADIGSIQHMVEEALELDEGDLMHYVNEVKDKVLSMVHDLIGELKEAYDDSDYNGIATTMVAINKMIASNYAFAEAETSIINKANVFLIKSDLEMNTTTLAPETVGKLQKAIAGARTIEHSKDLLPLINKAEASIAKLEEHIISKISHACIVVNVDHYLVLQDALLDAENAVQNGFKFNNKDQQVFENAEKMLVTLEKEWKERKELLNGLDNTLVKMQESKYSPPETVVSCFKAALILLEYKENNLHDWESISEQLYGGTLISKLEKTAIGAILPHLANSAKLHMQNVTADEITAISGINATLVLKLYKWVGSALTHLETAWGENKA